MSVLYQAHNFSLSRIPEDKAALRVARYNLTVHTKRNAKYILGLLNSEAARHRDTVATRHNHALVQLKNAAFLCQVVGTVQAPEEYMLLAASHYHAPLCRVELSGKDQVTVTLGRGNLLRCLPVPHRQPAVIALIDSA